jgi:hypothetical protein
MVAPTQQEPISWLMRRSVFGLLRQPTAAYKDRPLRLMLILEKGGVTDLTYGFVFNFRYYMAVLKAISRPADDAATIAKEDISFIESRFARG